jgi:8-amino-7-oxononanoate synthase
MLDFNSELRRDLDAIRDQDLYRRVSQIDSAQQPRIQTAGRELLNFSSNDYLGLANHPALKEAAIRAIERYGAGSGASRLICGSLAPHHELEQVLAAFKGTESALAFSSGYATALGTICALVGKEDIIILDRLVHACVVDAARLSGAKLRIFAHNDLDDLERVLSWADARTPDAPSAARQRRGRTLIVTESVFSMDGDHAALRALVELKDRHGAWLMVDEAHATGLYGSSGRGLADAEGVGARVEIQMGTLGKAFGASGGYICGSQTLIDLLINRARSFIFSTAPAPGSAAAAAEGVRLAQSGEGDQRRRQLWERVAQVYLSLPAISKSLGLNSLPSGEGNPSSDLAGSVSQKPPLWEPASAIIPLVVGAEVKAMELTARLREQGFLVPAIRYPTVGRGRARLRLTLTAEHKEEGIELLIKALADSSTKQMSSPRVY